MKVPEPIRKIYNFFPLYTYPETEQPSIEDKLYIYSFDTCDPGCLLAKAILTQYKVPHDVESASPYITPAKKLPILVRNKKPMNLDHMIANFVPVQDKQEPMIMAVLKRVENAYYTLIEETGDITNYQNEKDKKRLWPLNIAINKQTAFEAAAGIGYDRTTHKELEIALNALDNIVVERHGINLVDLMLYAVLKPLDDLVELPRNLQREMIRVTDKLDYDDGKQDLIVFSEEKPIEMTVEPEADMVIV